MTPANATDKGVKLTVLLPASLHRAVKIEAAKRCTTATALVIEGLRHILKGGAK